MRGIGNKNLNSFAKLKIDFKNLSWGIEMRSLTSSFLDKYNDLLYFSIVFPSKRGNFGQKLQIHPTSYKSLSMVDKVFFGIYRKSFFSPVYKIVTI